MIFRRFFSRTVREAIAMRKHIQRLLNAQRDLLSPQAVGAIQSKIDELNAALASGARTGAVRLAAEELQFTAEERIKTYPNAVWRENVEVLRSPSRWPWAFAPFSSNHSRSQPAQCSLRFTGLRRSRILRRIFGMHRITNDSDGLEKTALQAKAAQQVKLKNSIVIPTGWERFKEWVHGISYVHFVAPEDGSW